MYKYFLNYTIWSCSDFWSHEKPRESPKRLRLGLCSGGELHELRRFEKTSSLRFFKEIRLHQSDTTLKGVVFWSIFFFSSLGFWFDFLIQMTSVGGFTSFHQGLCLVGGCPLGSHEWSWKAQSINPQPLFSWPFWFESPWSFCVGHFGLPVLPFFSRVLLHGLQSSWRLSYNVVFGCMLDQD